MDNTSYSTATGPGRLWIAHSELGLLEGTVQTLTHLDGSSVSALEEQPLQEAQSYTYPSNSAAGSVCRPILLYAAASISSRLQVSSRPPEGRALTKSCRCFDSIILVKLSDSNTR